MLAYIQWARDPQRSRFGPLKFKNLGAYEVVDVGAINRIVGFLRMSNNEHFIIDRENHINFR